MGIDVVARFASLRGWPCGLPRIGLSGLHPGGGCRRVLPVATVRKPSYGPAGAVRVPHACPARARALRLPCGFYFFHGDFCCGKRAFSSSFSPLLPPFEVKSNFAWPCFRFFAPLLLLLSSNQIKSVFTFFGPLLPLFSNQIEPFLTSHFFWLPLVKSVCFDFSLFFALTIFVD